MANESKPRNVRTGAVVLVAALAGDPSSVQAGGASEPKLIKSPTQIREIPTLVTVTQSSKSKEITFGDLDGVVLSFIKHKPNFEQQLSFLNTTLFDDKITINLLIQKLGDKLHPQLILWSKSIPGLIMSRQESWYPDRLKLFLPTNDTEKESVRRLEKVFKLIKKIDLFAIKGDSPLGITSLFQQADWAQRIANNLSIDIPLENIDTEAIFDTYNTTIDSINRYGNLTPFQGNTLAVFRHINPFFFPEATKKLAEGHRNNVQVETPASLNLNSTQFASEYIRKVSDPNGPKVIYHSAHGKGHYIDADKVKVESPFLEFGKSPNGDTVLLHSKTIAEAVIKRLVGLTRADQKDNDMLWLVFDSCDGANFVTFLQKMFDQENARRQANGIGSMPPIGLISASERNEFQMSNDKEVHPSYLAKALFSGKNLWKIMQSNPEGSNFTFHILNSQNPTTFPTPGSIQLGENKSDTNFS